MADLANLGVTVNSKKAEKNLKEFGVELRKAGKESAKYEINVDKAVKQLKKEEKALEKNKKKLKENTKATERAAKATERLTQVTKKQTTAQKAANRTASKGVTIFGKSLTNAVSAAFTRFLTFIVILGGARAALDAIISTNLDFDRTMSAVAAVTGVGASQFNELREQAKELGATKVFTAAEFAEGMKFLGMAGFTAEQIASSIEAVGDLAAGTETSLGRTADIMSNIMSGFAIAAEDAANAADVMALTTASANTNLEQMGDAMSYVSPVASKLVPTFEEISAGVGILSNNGLKASRAGTGLRRIMSELSNPTKAARDAIRSMGLRVNDINPAMHDLETILERLAQRGLSAADAMRIFGDRGGPAILALVANINDFKELNQELQIAEGTANRLAQVRLNNLAGDLTLLRSALDGLFIEFFGQGVNDTLRILTLTTKRMVDNLTEFVKTLRNNTVIRGFLRVMGGIWTSVTDFLTGTEQTADPLNRIGENVQGIKDNIEKTAGSVGKLEEKFGNVNEKLNVMNAVTQATAVIFAVTLLGHVVKLVVAFLKWARLFDFLKGTLIGIVSLFSTMRGITIEFLGLFGKKLYGGGLANLSAYFASMQKGLQMILKLTGAIILRTTAWGAAVAAVGYAFVVVTDTIWDAVDAFLHFMGKGETFGSSIAKSLERGGLEIQLWMWKTVKTLDEFAVNFNNAGVNLGVSFANGLAAALEGGMNPIWDVLRNHALFRAIKMLTGGKEGEVFGDIKIGRIEQNLSPFTAQTNAYNAEIAKIQRRIDELMGTREIPDREVNLPYGLSPAGRAGQPRIDDVMLKDKIAGWKKELDKFFGYLAEQGMKFEDLMTRSMLDGFDRIVEGTDKFSKIMRDTFKQLAVDVIRELYRILVVQSAVNAVMSGWGRFGVNPVPNNYQMDRGFYPWAYGSPHGKATPGRWSDGKGGSRPGWYPKQPRPGRNPRIPNIPIEGSAPIVNLNVAPSGDGETRVDTNNNNGEVNIDLFLGHNFSRDIQSHGMIAQTLESQYGLRRRAR